MEKSLSQILANALAYYVNDPSKRCFKGGNAHQACVYSGITANKKTKGCFVGQFLTPHNRLKADIELKDKASSVYEVIDLANKKVIKIPKIIKNNWVIFMAFQVLHDDTNNWDELGLTPLGKKWLKEIITEKKLEEKYFEKFLVD